LVAAISLQFCLGDEIGTVSALGIPSHGLLDSLRRISWVRKQTGLPVPDQFTVARELHEEVSVSPRDQ
jgi:hypothetical protein